MNERGYSRLIHHVMSAALRSERNVANSATIEEASADHAGG